MKLNFQNAQNELIPGEIIYVTTLLINSIFLTRSLLKYHSENAVKVNYNIKIRVNPLNRRHQRSIIHNNITLVREPIRLLRLLLTITKKITQFSYK